MVELNSLFLITENLFPESVVFGIPYVQKLFFYGIVVAKDYLSSSQKSE